MVWGFTVIEVSYNVVYYNTIGCCIIDVNTFSVCLCLKYNIKYNNVYIYLFVK